MTENSRELTADAVESAVAYSRAGHRTAVDKALPEIYAELRRTAARLLRSERECHTLQTTALVHEAYLKLVGQRAVAWQNRAHLLAIVAIAMRQVLVDHARTRRAEKRDGGLTRVELDEAVASAEARDVDLLALDEALERLEAFDPRMCRVVELRYFAGLTNQEAAEVLGVSVATIDRDRATATAWLRRELAPRARS